MRTYRRSKKNGTRRKKRAAHSLDAFQQEIVVMFLEMLMMVKLYHWKTTSYATHKATDELHSKLHTNVDAFVEILLGKSGARMDLTGRKHVKLVDLSSADTLKQEVDRFKRYLVGLNDHPALRSMSNTDLFSIRDTILGDLNQFLYLLTFR